MNICDGKAKAEDEDKDIAKLPIGSVFEFGEDIYILCGGWYRWMSPYAVNLTKNSVHVVPDGKYTKLFPPRVHKAGGLNG